MSSHWEDFYASYAHPHEFEENKKLLQDFCQHHLNLKQKIVLITSGGTAVPLEHNTVRFVDNFSAGTRGSASAEYFLQEGYAVIFMFRMKSLEPFVRHFMGQKFLDLLELNNMNGTSTVNVKNESVKLILPILTKYKEVQESHRLLCIPFTSLSDYMWLLRAACEALAPFGQQAVLYLAAAVSDFYIPSNEMPIHKMQSNSGPPTISLQLVPKMLEPLVSLWVPNAFVVSFKLETDENLLISKARVSLQKYKHKMVIANILQTRKHRVVFVTPDINYEVTLNEDEIQSGLEIESKIVLLLTKKHVEFIEGKL